MTFDLVGIGNPVYDVIVTPWARTDGRVLSGCSTNACLAAKRLGVKKVGLVGCIGQDFAKRFRRDMQNYGIEINLDTASKDTGGFRLVYDQTGNRTLDVLGVAGKITRDNLPEEFLDSDFILIGPILGEVDLGLIEFLHSSSRSKLFLDPQGLVRMIEENRRVIHSCNKTEFKKIAQMVDFIKPNEHEAVTITGEKDPLVALRRLDELGPAISIVTLAERGSLLSQGGKMYHVPAFSTQAIDPTGAGDVYAGSFITEYRRTGSPVEAALFASAAASLMVEQVGPDFRMASESVKRRKEAIRDQLITETFGQ